MRRLCLSLLLVGIGLSLIGCAATSRDRELKEPTTSFDPKRKEWIEDWSQIHPRKQW
jgi:hypothetical protein